MKKFPNWDKKKLLAELKEEQERNREERLRFIDLYVEWLKRKSDKDWEKRRKDVIAAVYRRRNPERRSS